MDLENVIHSEVRKRKKYRLVMHIHGILKKNGIIYAPLDDPIRKAGIDSTRGNASFGAYPSEGGLLKTIS